jgi:DNA transformation protein
VASSSDYVQYVLEQLAGLGGITSRRMFGGVGIYCGGVFFALISDDTLYFKVGAGNRAEYEARGMAPFRPYADRPEVSMSYYAVPADALEERETLAVWARAAVVAAASGARRHSSGVRRRPVRGK